MDKVEELQKFINDGLGFRVINGFSSRSIAEAIINAGYVKAPKNELLPLCGTEIYNKLWDMTKALELNFHRCKSNQESRDVRNNFIKRFCEWINQFGSSGKRPLDWVEVDRVIYINSSVKNGYKIPDAKRKMLSKLIAETFSTAEVSEERIKRALVRIAQEHKMQFDNKLETVEIFGELDKLAKVIKEELEKGK